MTKDTDQDHGSQDTPRPLADLLGLAPVPWQVAVMEALERGEVLEWTRGRPHWRPAHHGREGSAFGSPLPLA